MQTKPFTLLVSGKSSGTHGFLYAIKGHRVSGGIRAAVAQETVASAKKILWDSLLRKTMANSKERIDALEAQIQDMFKSDHHAPGILKQFSPRLDASEENLEATDHARHAEVVNTPTWGMEHSLRPRVPQPKSYGGARDAKELENFIFYVEQYFRAIRVDLEETKVSMATMYLVGDAKLWWWKKYAEIEEGSCVINTWEILKHKLKSQFFPENTAFNARKALLECKHTRSVREYCQAFSALMLDISDMSAVDGLFFFMEGRVKAINSAAQPVAGIARSVLIKVGPYEGRTHFSVVTMDDFKLILRLELLRDTKTTVMPCTNSLAMLGNKPCVIPTISLRAGERSISALQLKKGLKWDETTYLAMLWACSTNSVADALSRRTELDQLALAAMNAIVRANSRVAINIGNKIKKALTKNSIAQQLLKLVESGKTQQFWQEDGLLMTKGRRVYVPRVDDLRRTLIRECHDTLWAGHARG
ncbi:hypothetical protein RJ640_015669 [Escallonia rubra]|uniref:Retrotransposon gag domain-containing protein n=1 Tax=Escallonia rubra TaxID=112253 RepID=A0AA88REL7_9ASTE|nr:hypothetical protein RJ640_015669 [Escallonia rubra]